MKPAPGPADLLITGARVCTMDPGQPWAEAVALRGARIVAVGPSSEVAVWRGPATRVIQAGGRSLLPGFIDSHFHLLSGALGLGDMQLGGVRSLDHLAAVIGDYGRAYPEAAWLVGRGLPYGVVSPTEPLTRHHLDAIEARRPVLLLAYDLHTAWANTPALTQAGRLHGAGPLGGEARVCLGPDGLANGELRESPAYAPLLQVVPRADEARRRALLKQALAHLASLGITSVHNMDGDARQATLYAALEDRDELTLRVYVPYSVRPEMPPEALVADAAPMRRAFPGPLVRAGSVKFFLDGVLESYTAMLLAGYPDRPDHHGSPIFAPEQFARLATEADRLGLQICVHACGDGAVRLALDGFAAARRANGPRDSRHRIEHIELVDPADLPRFADLGVVASMQPAHAPRRGDEPDLWLRRIRPADHDRSFAWPALRRAGARLVFGSDWPVAAPSPLLGMHAALNRQPWASGDAPQRLTLLEALAAYTSEAAYAEFQEAYKGRIRPGLWADLVLLDRDIFSQDPATLDQTRVDLTVCHGQVVYESPAAPAMGNDSPRP